MRRPEQSFCSRLFCSGLMMVCASLAVAQSASDASLNAIRASDRADRTAKGGFAQVTPAEQHAAITARARLLRTHAEAFAYLKEVEQVRWEVALHLKFVCKSKVKFPPADPTVADCLSRSEEYS